MCASMEFVAQGRLLLHASAGFIKTEAGSWIRVSGEDGWPDREDG